MRTINQARNKYKKTTQQCFAKVNIICVTETAVLIKTGHSNGTMTCGDSSHHAKPLFKDEVNENILYILIQWLH